MQDMRVHDTRLGLILPSVRNPEPPEEWIHKAKAEVEAQAETGITFQETSWGYRVKRERQKK